MSMQARLEKNTVVGRMRTMGQAHVQLKKYCLGPLEGAISGYHKKEIRQRQMESGVHVDLPWDEKLICC